MGFQEAELAEERLLSPLGTGYHQCWYPVALSPDLLIGSLQGLDFCDGRIVLFRGEDGVARALSPYCKHMGSDLSVGDVVGNELRCAFHHWQYGPDGACTTIPSGDRIPRGAKLTRFPVEERFGVIWVFFGSEPTYSLPTFPEWDADTLTYVSFEIDFPEPLRCDPWVFASNAFDFQHLRIVHGMNVDVNANDISVDDHTLRLALEFEHPHGGQFQLTFTLHGTNCLVTHGAHDGRPSMHIAASTSMGMAGTRFFMTVAVPKVDADGNARPPDEVTAEAAQLQAMHNQLVTEDLPIMNTLRMDRNLVPADRAMTRYFRYARKYPRATMASLVGRS